jgi:phosphohistidine phosphatase
MHRLMLFRHAKSAYPAGVDDHERPLADRGRKSAPIIGHYLADQRLVPDLAVVSTARRAQETWALAADALGRDIPRRAEGRIYEARPAAILEIVRQTRSDVGTLVLVGHNPGFQDLATELIGGGDKDGLARLRAKFSTAGLAVIDFDVQRWSDLTAGGGRLERFVTPKSIKAEQD